MDSDDMITIVLPLPEKALSPNARVGWWIKCNTVGRARLRAFARTRSVLGDARPQWPAATIRAIFYHAQRRRRDVDNLNASLKAYVDGIVSAGLLQDDEQLMWLPTRRFIDRDRPRVELRLRNVGVVEI